MNLIRLILRKSHKITLLAAMASIGAGLATTVLMAFINRVLAQKQAPPHDGLIYFGICLFSIILTAVSQILLIRVAQRGTLELRMDLNRRILNTPLRQLEETGPGRLLAALTEHVGEIAQAITVVPVLSTNLTIVFCCIAYLFWLSWVSMISIVAFVVIGIAGFQLIALIATESLKIAHKDQDTLVGHFRSVVNGIKELKLHRRRREEFVSRALEGTELSLLRNRQKALTLFTLGNVYASSLLYLTLGLFLFVLPALLPLSWTQTLSSIMVMMFFMGPLGAVVGLLPVFSRANTALKKFESLGMSLVDVPPGDAVSGQPLQERRDSWSRLDLEGIAHTYYSDDHAFTLGPISLSFGPREIVFVVGGNGSGKTTLAKLLVGLYAPEAGEIRLDRELITEANREHYRQFFSAIFSDCHLFESLFGLDAVVVEPHVQQLLTRMQLDKKLTLKDGVFSTLELSQGQRKRLALLTACLEDRPFYVFDEWAADQDPGFRDIFYNQIIFELKASGKTVIIITHDDRYFHLADRIVKLDCGRIITETFREQLPNPQMTSTSAAANARAESGSPV